MICRGENDIGQKYFAKIAWKENHKVGDKCWKRIKKTLHGVRVRRLSCYTKILQATKEKILCHPTNIKTRCADSYLYKQMTKFVYFI